MSEFVFKIEKDIPVPPKTGAHDPRFDPMEKMKPGESVPIPKAHESGARGRAAKLRKLGYEFVWRSNPDKKAGGGRLWCLKNPNAKGASKKS